MSAPKTKSPFLIAAALAVSLAAVSLASVAPSTVSAQTAGSDPNTAPLPPTVVRDIGPKSDPYLTPNRSAVLGAAAAVIGFNVVTSGLVLTPVVGATASNILGGAWLGALAPLPATAASWYATGSTVAVAFTGASIGYWLAPPASE